MSLHPIQDHRSPCFDQTKRWPTFHFHPALYFLTSKSLRVCICGLSRPVPQFISSNTLPIVRGREGTNKRTSEKVKHLYCTEDMGVCFVVCTLRHGCGFSSSSPITPLFSISSPPSPIPDTNKRSPTGGVGVDEGTHTHIRWHSDTNCRTPVPISPSPG